MTFKDRLLIVLGFLLLGLGAIGIFLPILPTTPFVLVAAACFSGSPRLTAWLRKSRLFSDYITNYKERNGLSKRTVAKSLAFLWIMLGISVAWIKALWAAVLLPCIGLAVTIHILCIARPKNKECEVKEPGEKVREPGEPDQTAEDGMPAARTLAEKHK